MPSSEVTPSTKGGETTVTTTALTTSNTATPVPPRRVERVYVGIDVGYRHHVAAASPVSVFNAQRDRDAWKRVRTVRFSSDAAGFAQLQRYLDHISPDPAVFMVLLEPTGGYYGLTLLIYLLGKGYQVLQVENRAVKDYREKVFGGETKTDDVDARLMARMGFLHDLVGEEFSIQPVQLGNSDAAALRVMVRDLGNLQRELTRRKNQLQQIVAATFPELKTFFRNSTASPAARALLTRFPRPQDFMRAEPEEIAEVLRGVSAYRHAKRADEIRDLARDSAGVPLLTHHQWRQGWLIRQMDVLEEARSELVEQLRQSIAKHPYTPIIESLPLKSPIWTATLIAVIGDIHRFRTWNEFRAYMGWYPQVGRSGTSTDSNRLAKGGVRLGRNAPGQMAVLLQTPNVRNTRFREVYKRLLGRGMKPSTAQGHIAGKLCDVLYGMLKTMTLYDEAQHRRQLGLKAEEIAIACASIEAPIEVVETLDDDLNSSTERA